LGSHGSPDFSNAQNIRGSADLDPASGPDQRLEPARAGYFFGNDHAFAAARIMSFPFFLTHCENLLEN
jgi:hypothetical protein